MKARWYPYYPDEWLVGCARLNLADCGLYITACMLMYSHGGPIAVVDLKAACQDHGNAINAALTRLVKLGKLIREGDILRNLRVEKELEKAWKRSGNGLENVRKRWRNGEEKEPTSANINGVASADLMQLGNANHNHNHNHKERNARELRSAFDAWWKAYPHKVGKGAAERSFKTACKLVTAVELIDGVKRYIAGKPPDRPWCNPSTWLNQRRWEDEPDAEKSADALPAFWSGFDQPDAVRREPQWAARLKSWAEGNRFWMREQWGPQPDQTGCQAPPPLLTWAMQHQQGRH